jgi:hypothetical protein
MKRPRLFRPLAAVALALSTVGAGAAIDASPAAAASSYIGSNSGGANVRSSPSITGSFIIAYLRNGTPVRMLCWADWGWVHPPNSDYSSNRWFKIDAYFGYVHSSLVENQTSVPHCPGW